MEGWRVRGRVEGVGGWVVRVKEGGVMMIMKYMV